MLSKVEAAFSALQVDAEDGAGGGKIVKVAALCGALRPVLQTSVELKECGMLSVLGGLERAPSIDCQLQLLEGGRIQLNDAADLLALCNHLNKM